MCGRIIPCRSGLHQLGHPSDDPNLRQFQGGIFVKPRITPLQVVQFRVPLSATSFAPSQKSKPNILTATSKFGGLVVIQGKFIDYTVNICKYISK